MREVQLVAGLLEQVGQPLPAVGRFERDLSLIAQFAEQAEKGLGLVDDLRERISAPSRSRTAICERLRWRSMPTYIIAGPPSVPTSTTPLA